VKKLSKDLTLKLNRWKGLNMDGMSAIEMKVLERTVDILKENENIEATDYP
jgi:hypothetical protein